MAVSRLVGAVCALLAVLLGLVAAQVDEGLVTVGQGSLRGVVEATHRAFFGIPYTQPPIGSLRWRRPTAPPVWSGVYDATLRRSDCIQSDPDRRWFTGTSEDCLYLNIWTPRAPNGTTPVWPVLTFFHGGSNTQGGTSVPIYNGAGVVQLRPDVVVITANYRLNVFGFLGGAPLAAETTDGSNGNYAILDQRAVLEWVRSNIAAFGGDPNRVTIFGESAGSWDVQSHLVFPKSKGLFVGAIMESGASEYDYSQLTQEQADANFDAFASALGCTNPDCLRAVPAFELGRRTSLGQYRWQPTVDGVELFDRISTLVTNGDFTRVPILIGSNEDEVPAIAPRNLTAEAYQAIVLAVYGPVDGAQLLRAYPASAYASPWFAFQQLLTDGVFTCIVLRNTKWMAPYTPTRTYYFTHTTGIGQRAAPALGAFHGTELPFVFNFAPLLTIEDDYTVAQHMVAYWTNFAHTGNPNTGGLTVPVSWPQYSASAPNNQHLVIQPVPQLRGNLKQAECAVWDAIQTAVDVRKLAEKARQFAEAW